MIDIALYAIYIIFFIAPIIYAGLHPFRDKFRLKIKYMIILYITLFSVQFIGHCILNVNYVGSVESIVYKFIWGWIYVVASCIVVKDRASKPIFVCLVLTVIYGLTLSALHKLLIYSLSIIFKMKISNYTIGIGLLVVDIISVPFIFYIMEKYVRIILDEVENEVWDSLSINLGIVVIIGQIYLYDIGYIYEKHITYIVISLIICISIISTMMILMNSLKRNKNSLQLQYKLESMDKIMIIQQEQYLALSKRANESRQQRHNKRYHINAINEYVHKNDKDGLMAYIRSFMGEIPAQEIIYCNNNTINNILDYYIREAKIYNIKADTKIVFPIDEGYELENIKHTDLWVLLGNILENAIEACNKIEESDKLIKIRINLINNMLIITIDNSFNGEIKKCSDEIFYSSKEENRIGVGIESIKVISHKYGGTCKFEYDEEQFYTSVMLRNNN